MATIDGCDSTEACPWCGDEIGDSADPVVVRPKRAHADPARMHDDCAREWTRFLDDAKSLATRGRRSQLLDAPLEKGFDVETAATDAPGR